MDLPDRDMLLHTLKHRFERHLPRRTGIAWSAVQARLGRHPGAQCHYAARGFRGLLRV